jgi:uncharacterized membrane protein
MECVELVDSLEVNIKMKNNRLSQEGGTNKISLVLLSLLVIAIFFIDQGLYFLMTFQAFLVGYFCP